MKRPRKETTVCAADDGHTDDGPKSHSFTYTQTTALDAAKSLSVGHSRTPPVE